MAKRNARYSATQKGAILVGVILAGLDALGAFQYAQKLEAGSINYLVLAAPLVAIAACTLPFFAEQAWHEGRKLKAIFLFIAFLPAAWFVGQTALERVAMAQDQARSARQLVNQPVIIARDALAKAEQDLADAKARRETECDDGPGPKCLDKKAEEQKARERADDARQTLASAGVEVEADPAAKALQAMVPFLTVETVERYRPAVLPVTLLVVSFSLIAYGASPRKIEKPKKSKAKRRKARKPRTTAPKIASENVVPFKRKQLEMKL